MAEQQGFGGVAGGGEKRRRDTPIACQAQVEMGYLKIGRDVKRVGWQWVRVGSGVGGEVQKRMKGLKHERKADMG